MRVTRMLLAALHLLTHLGLRHADYSNRAAVEVKSKLGGRMSIENKRILVTGAGSGMGQEVVRESLRQGAEHVVMIDINEQQLIDIAHDMPEASDTNISLQVLDLRNGS